MKSKASTPGKRRYVFLLWVLCPLFLFYMVFSKWRYGAPAFPTKHYLPRSSLDYDKNASEIDFGNKKFIYMTQTEGCLSDYYLGSPNVLGDPQTCQCDVIVLTYKRECKTNKQQHVQYLFNSDTTFTTGRNLLYKTAMARERKYMYYTFFDDDIHLNYLDPSKKKAENPWRDYELSLVTHRPLVISAWYKTPQVFGGYFSGQCSYPVPPDILPFQWYDAAFNSFDHRVIQQLLPYYDKMEATSIWYSQIYLIIKTDIMYPGQAMLSVNILAPNPAHRSYARQWYNGETIKKLLPDLRKEIPAEYADKVEPILQDWVDNVYSYEWSFYNTEGKMCAPYPVVNRKFVPYDYF